MPIPVSDKTLSSRISGTGISGLSEGEGGRGARSSGTNSGNNSGGRDDAAPKSDHHVTSKWPDLFAKVMLALCAVYLYIVYALSLFPGVAGGDSGELLAAACSGSVARKSPAYCQLYL
jgi:hypothetical protein